MSRFITVSSESDLDMFDDPNEWAWKGEWDDPFTVVVDTKKNEIVFADRCEPEDASVHRHYSQLISLLNITDEESK